MNQIIIKLFLIVGIGAMIGWITNYIAIKMLFRPYKEMNFLFFKIQGLIPKRRSEIAVSIADTVQKELISLKDIINSLNADELEEKMGAVIDKILEEKLESEITKKFPMLAMFLSDEIINKIKSMIKTSILENKETIINMFTSYLEEKVDFKKIIIENVEAFSLEKLEEITYSLAKKELKHIEVIGAILGGIIGIFQFAISLFV
ncbi:MAG: DUF445 domain-containing protein [Fusobacterium sp.]|jgi:uncharacterized membrane protein YheB (UPF0754 family)|uniref:DUF445 domain-containing protein n=1 Tax=Fusobacterium sp. TaxID=68766 RepID=UPI0015A5EE22|nr:DUF445 family protein [uncultured Fusobacterium sp.]